MEKVNVDFSKIDAPAAVKNFMPDVYREGEKYISILGTGSNALKGEGSSIEEALQEWNRKYQEITNYK